MLRAAVLISFVYIVIFSDFVSGNGVFTGVRSWLKPAKKVDSKLQQCLKLRGGSSDGGDSEKVKGVCIGIDLGTTYR